MNTPSHAQKKIIYPIDALSVLRFALAERCRKNPSYSIRAFARSSGINITVLSLALSGKRRLSKKATLQLASYLQMDPTQRDALLTGRSVSKTFQNFNTLTLDTFHVISDWHHYAILSALELAETVLEPRAIAKQIGISVLDAKLAIERLKNLELVEEVSEGRWKQTNFPLKIDNATSTAATRKFHHQFLARAAESIENDPISDRDFSTMTFAMNSEQVEHARKRIRAFRRKLVAELESLGTPNAVFQLNLQLFPLTKISRTK